MKTEYQVFWKRVGKAKKSRTFKTRRGADNFLQLFGPEPWKAMRVDPDTRVCCAGDMCACGGVTYREQSAAQRKSMPKLEYIGVRVRSVSEWVQEFCDELLPEVDDRDDGRELAMQGVKTGLDHTNDPDLW